MEEDTVDVGEGVAEATTGERARAVTRAANTPLHTPLHTIGRRADVLEDTLTRDVSDVTDARVLALEVRGAHAELAHDEVRELVPAVLARRIGARDLEERRRVFDDDAPDVRHLRRDDAGPPLLKLERQALEGGHLGEQARGLVFTTPSLGEPIRGVTIAPVHQESRELRRPWGTRVAPRARRIDVRF